MQQQVVTARDHLPAGAASYSGAPAQPGADRQVAVPGQQRCDQRQQRVEVGGQVHVHVGEHLGIAAAPHGLQRAAAAGQLESHGVYAGQLRGQLGRDRPGVVGAAVVRDRDDRGERKADRQMRVQPADAGSHVVLLVAYRDDDLDVGWAGGA